MNIDRIQSQLIRLYGSRGHGVQGSGGTGGTSSADETGSTRSADGFVLSDEANTIRQMVGVVTSAPDVRENLVAELRSQVQDGTYQPNDQAVAQKLLGLSSPE